MEEKDIKIIEWLLINKLYIDTHNTGDYHDIHASIENLLQAYKQDEKIIQEMANYIKNEWGFANNNEVIDYFRKRVEKQWNVNIAKQ